ncbi:MAG: hypothetical protein B7Y12_23640 [Rhizobiales bacterium 24-66-13]|nr:MAG: hypothetical protein B7Y61_11555 [Rhizobiales bacterium 35-66-30]OYZ65932.1 MAG: hypothetical protein B7Y12_23640 [Rhizobiales bacterium 24-66-13]
MKHARFAILAGASALAFVIPSSQAAAHSVANAIGAAEIARVVQGKTCSTKAGAKFSFGTKGQYAYDGLWKNDGHYRISTGLITVRLHSGLERSFAVTTKSSVLYLEDTALSCATDLTVAGSH